MENNTHTCPRCEAEFDEKSRYLAHIGRKHPCKKRPIQNLETKITLKVNEDDVLDFGPDIETRLREPLEPFDPNKLMKTGDADNFSMVLTASRRSGKTTLLRYLYPKWEKIFDIIFVYSYSIHNEAYAFVKEPKFDSYNPDSIKDIFKFQKKTSNKFRILIIFDDLVSKSVKDDDSILQAYIRGRNSNISIVISTQIFKLIAKNNRGNLDYLFCGKTNMSENRLTLIENVFMNSVKMPDVIKNKTQKIEFLDRWLIEHTTDFHFVVVDCFEDNEKLYDFKVPLNST